MLGIEKVISKGAEALGLVPDFGPALEAAKFNPVNTQGLFGGVSWNPQTRTFSSNLDPRLTGIQNTLFSQFGQANPEAEYALMQQMAAPYREQQMLGLENRLFSQGLLGASMVDQPGGARRSLFDAFANQDLGMQQQAIQSARTNQINLLNQIFGLQNMENSLFANNAGLSGQAQAANNNVANILAQDAAFMPNALWSLGGAIGQGYATGGFGGGTKT